MPRIGRPPTCICGDCVKCKHRQRRRKAYQALSPEERRARIARRDPEKVRAADRARYQRDRQARLAAQEAYRLRYPERYARSTAEAKQRWAGRNPEKVAATQAVSNAIRDGHIIRQPCEHAEPSCSGRVEAHHDDYSKPLEVRWLCVAHHKAHHVALREAA